MGYWVFEYRDEQPFAKDCRPEMATGTADQSKTCSESQWLIVAGLFALGREFHCDMFATISTSASLAACAKIAVA